MEIIIVVLLIVYIGFREWLYYLHIKDLELKLLAKTPQEYASYKRIEKPVKAPNKVEEDELVDPLDIDPNDALKGLGGKNG